MLNSKTGRRLRDSRCNARPVSGGRSWVPRLAVGLLLACLTVVSVRGAIAVSRHSVMVAFVFNFTSFIDWPDTPPYNDGPFVIASYKEDPYDGVFRALTQRDVGGRPITYQVIDSLEEAEGALHMLFVPAAFADEMPDLYRQLDGQPTLTIGETDDFTRQGGMVRFFEDRDNLRVEINQRLTDDANLGVRARLLRLANRVRHRAPR